MDQKRGSNQNSGAGEDHLQEAWQNARQYAALAGGIPSSFTSVTRALIADSTRNAGELSSGTEFIASRLLKGKSLLAPFYFMSEVAFPGEFEDRLYISHRDLMDLYKPFDLAAFIMLIYLNRRMATICPNDEWKFVVSQLQKQVDIGLQLGLSIPAIGVGNCLLACALETLSLGVFLLHDKKGFTEYRRKISSNPLSCDHTWELARWGCTSAHVGATFVQIFGLGVNTAYAFLLGTSAKDSIPEVNPEIQEDVYRFYIAKQGLKSLFVNKKVPNIAHRGEYYPEGGIVTSFLERVEEIHSISTNDNGWLFKSRDAISPESTPMLFRAASGKRPSAQPSAPVAEETAYGDEDFISDAEEDFFDDDPDSNEPS